jgi:hypothetical protein
MINFYDYKYIGDYGLENRLKNLIKQHNLLEQNFEKIAS